MAAALLFHFLTELRPPWGVPRQGSVQEAGPDCKKRAQRNQAKDGPNLSSRHLTRLGVTIGAVILLVLSCVEVDIAVLVVLTSNDVLNEAADLLFIGLLIEALVRTILGIVHVAVAFAGNLVQILAQLVDVIGIFLVAVHILIRLVRFAARGTVRVVVHFQLAEVVVVGTRGHDASERYLVANVNGAVLVGVDTNANGGLVGLAVRPDVVLSSHLLTIKVIRQVNVIVVAVVVVSTVVVAVIAHISVGRANVVIRAAPILVVVSVVGIVLLLLSVVGVVGIVLFSGCILEAAAAAVVSLLLFSLLFSLLTLHYTAHK